MPVARRQYSGARIEKTIANATSARRLGIAGEYSRTFRRAGYGLALTWVPSGYEMN